MLIRLSQTNPDWATAIIGPSSSTVDSSLRSSFFTGAKLDPYLRTFHVANMLADIFDTGIPNSLTFLATCKSRIVAPWSNGSPARFQSYMNSKPSRFGDRVTTVIRSRSECQLRNATLIAGSPNLNLTTINRYTGFLVALTLQRDAKKAEQCRSR